MHGGEHIEESDCRSAPDELPGSGELLPRRQLATEEREGEHAGRDETDLQILFLSFPAGAPRALDGHTGENQHHRVEPEHVRHDEAVPVMPAVAACMRIE